MQVTTQDILSIKVEVVHDLILLFEALACFINTKCMEKANGESKVVDDLSDSKVVIKALIQMKYVSLQVETYQGLHILLFLMEVRKGFDNFLHIGIT